MGVGPNLVMSGCFALLTLVYFLLQRHYGADVRLWMLIYFPVLLFVMTFSFNHWQQPLKRFARLVERAGASGFLEMYHDHCGHGSFLGDCHHLVDRGSARCF
ncbi:MAG: hypothetical protein ACOX0J_08560 [Thermoactinomyces vulgaris]